MSHDGGQEKGEWMTRIYTTREGQTWIVTSCAELPLHPGFFLGFRHTDGQQVLIHEHRSREVRETEDPQEATKRES